MGERERGRGVVRGGRHAVVMKGGIIGPFMAPGLTFRRARARYRSCAGNTYQGLLNQYCQGMEKWVSWILLLILSPGDSWGVIGGYC